MMNEQKMTFTDIAQYLERPDAPEHASLRRRLMSDAHARQRTDLLQGGIDMLRNDPGLLADDSGAQSTDGDLGLRDVLRSQLLDSERVLTLQGSHRESWWRGWLRPSVPAWGAVTATVAMAALTAALTLNWPDESVQLASFRDDTNLHVMSDSLPGIGFFTGSRTELRSYGEVQVDLVKQRVRLRWPAIEGVVEYHLQLLRVNGEVREALANGVSSTNEFTFPQALTETQRRYEWTIGGQLDDERRFETRGGFVLQ